ncbi:glycoside hydrolase family protein [Acidithiobacillus sp. AMEEHan]|uniref:glycoside hydrolase family protein n=1 Tax=Acidithiobacillus sp. AMEEHan TaxID=2994951 RepID=UPI0027E47046|nr:glycoside hydrolase family protein [Acidithiobacillus sp. AMEEHan]
MIQRIESTRTAQRKAVLVALSSVAFLFQTLDAQAMNCRLAQTPTEKAICSDPELKLLDARLGRDYAALKSAFQNSSSHACVLPAEAARQTEWLAKRDACGANAACLKKAYEERLTALGVYARACVACASPTTPVASTTGPTSSDAKKCEPISTTNNQREIEAYNKSHFVVSESGKVAIRHYEGMVNCLYEDSVGLATVGIGHLIEPRGSIKGLPTRAPKEWEKYRSGVTDEQALTDMDDDIKTRIKEYANKQIKVKLTTCQMDALMSFFFNLGPGISSIYNLLNKCDWKGVANKMKEYNKAGNKVNQGLVDRRKGEADLFLECKYPESSFGRKTCCDYSATINSKKQTFKAKCKSSCKPGGSCYGL